MAEATEAGIDEATAWKLQGNINYKQGNYNEALLFYEKGLNIDPESIDILNNKGMALVKLGRIDEARQCQREIKRLKEDHNVKMDLSSAVSNAGPEKKGQCTVKIKGSNGSIDVFNNRPAPAITEFTDKALQGELQLGDIEQNIELIKNGLEKVRLGRIKEAKECKLQMKEMEENIELTQQGLDMVKMGRIEEDRKILFIEENLELTKKGLELIKLGRREEAKHYNQQLKEIEERIGLTRKSLKQVKPAEAETGPVRSPGVNGNGGNTGRSAKETPLETPGGVRSGTDSAPQMKDIEYIIGVPDDDDQPVAHRRIKLVSILFIFFIVIILGYFAFLK